MVGGRWRDGSMLDGGPVKRATRLLERAVIWILLENSPEEVIPLGSCE